MRQNLAAAFTLSGALGDQVALEGVLDQEAALHGMGIDAGQDLGVAQTGDGRDLAAAGQPLAFGSRGGPVGQKRQGIFLADVQVVGPLVRT